MITTLLDTMRPTIPCGLASKPIQRRCSTTLTAGLVAMMVLVAPVSALAADIDHDNDGILNVDEGFTTSVIAFTDPLVGTTSNGVSVAGSLFEDANGAADNQTFDNANFTFVTDATSIDGKSMQFDATDISSLPRDLNFSFSGADVSEVHLHLNSLDQIRMEMLLAENPTIGFETVSGVAFSQTGTGGDMSWGDDNQADVDTSAAGDRADGYGQGSADGTIRFFSLDGSPIIQLNLNIIEQTGHINSNDGWQMAMEVVTSRDSDGDGVADYKDIDSDSDGITDNVEAQSTAGYIAPSGTGAAMADLNSNGLDDNYEVAAGTAGFNADGIGLATVDTDSTLFSNDGVADYLDRDSDNDGIEDAAERGTAGPVTAQTGVASDATTDADSDGLLDVFEGADAADGFDVNDENRDATSVALADTDGDLNADATNADPLKVDSDFREALDTDGDNVQDILDFDDDNDGILDSHERAALRNDQTVVYVNDNNGNLLSINDPDGSPVVNLIGNSGVVFGDLAMAPDGTLYGIELSTSELYSIDTTTGEATAIGVIPGVSGANALSFDGNGLAYVGGVGSTIQRFDPANIAGSTLWHDFGSGSPGGDFVFFEGEAFIAWFDSSENFIRRVSLDASNDYVSDQRLGDLPSSSFGLSADVDGNLYVVANGSSGFGLYQFDRPNSPISGEIPNTLVPGTALVSGEYYGATSNVEAILGAPKDRDGDGIADHRDIDSDNDGITDNVEAQTTAEYIAPSGTAAAMTDLNSNGLDDNYEVAAGTEGFNPDGIGLAAVDTDSALSSADDVVDYLDLDSDNDGIEDAAERGTTGPETAQTDVVSDATTDADGDGLLDVFEGSDSGDGFVVNDENRNTFLILLSDSDGDLNNSSSGSGSVTPLNTDSDFREALDTDGDNIHDEQDIDDDNDGIPDSLEIANASVDGDTDDDGVHDYLDLDSDDDGIADAIEGHDADKDGDADVLLSGVDSDGDGLDNAFDTDNGGVAAALQDSDTDGKADYVDVDSDGDGITDAAEAKTDTDSDNLPDYLDLDSDGDGVTDTVEAFDTDNNGVADITASGDDTDGDGLDNAFDPDDGGVSASTQDFDMDGLVDSIDVDSDGDGITDIVEGTVDTDDDGMPDYLDTDSDNDGIDDAVEAFDANGDGVADAVATGVDTDGDGLDDAYDVDNGGLTAPLQDTDDDTIPDYLDVDSDGDGVTDIVEAITDTDNDGMPDYLDTDSDNDGIDDAIEAFDANFDGVADAIATGVDTDGDGLDDAYDVDNGGLAAPIQDADNDNIADYLDNDNDSDNDGIPDVTEIGTDPMNPLDADDDGTPDYLDEDSDNDGIVDTIEGVADSDDDGIPDYLDLDSDNDGITDIVEAGGGLVDTDGDGVVDNFTDENGNGVDDSIEAEPHLLPDSDNDGVLDYLDLDSDNDGITDIIESQGINADLDGDAMVDDFLDSDGDGLDDSLILAPTMLIDTDGDGIFDHHDVDADNDGLLDVVEAGGVDIDGDGRIDAFADTDSDGTPDAIDADWTGGVDADGDGVDDVADADFVVFADTDGDGIIDSHDVDANGDGIVDSYADAALLSGLVLPDDNGNLVPNYLEVTPLAATGLVQTGLSGNGCSVGGEQSRNDPLLLLLGLFGLVGVRRVGMMRILAHNATDVVL